MGAVAAMGASQTYVFRVFFRQFFLVTLLGGVHGLIVLPALLSVCGPKKAIVYEDDDDDVASPKQIPASTPKEKDGDDSNSAEIEMNLVSDGAGSTDTKSTDSFEAEQ